MNALRFCLIIWPAAESMFSSCEASRSPKTVSVRGEIKLHCLISNLCIRRGGLHGIFSVWRDDYVRTRKNEARTCCSPMTAFHSPLASDSSSSPWLLFHGGRVACRCGLLWWAFVSCLLILIHEALTGRNAPMWPDKARQVSEFRWQLLIHPHLYEMITKKMRKSLVVIGSVTIPHRSIRVVNHCGSFRSKWWPRLCDKNQE
jgi:hypothetical protein